MHTRSLARALTLALLLLAACSQAVPPTPITIVETVVVTEVLGDRVVEVVVTNTPAPTASPTSKPAPSPNIVKICLRSLPDTLYIYGGSMLAAAQVRSAIYDGPIDNRSFDYQAVILEKLPSLADDDAFIRSAEVAPGERLVDSDGEPGVLEPGVVYRPSGCRSADCAQTYSPDDGSVTLDQMVVTFKLLPGLLWSDGAPLTSADSVYSYNVAANPDTPSSKFVIDRTTSYEAPDDVTLVWTGLPGYIDSTYFLNLWHPLPEHAWGQYTAAELIQAEEVRSTPMGWGPYVIDEWDTNAYILALSKNPHYFRADEGLPKFDRAVYRFVGGNANANIARILSGECDIVDHPSHNDNQFDILNELQAAGRIKAVFQPGTIFEHADFGILPACFDTGGWANCIAEGRPDVFGDVRTRRAFTKCMDRQAVVDSVFYGQSIVLDSYIPSEHPLFNPDVTTYPFDPSAGSALLEGAGWTLDGSEDGVRVYAGDDPNIPSGTRLSISYWTTSAAQRQQSTQILAATMAECGIEILLDYWPPAEIFADGPEGPLFGRRFDIGQFAWLTDNIPPCDLWLTEAIPGEDPEVYPYRWEGWNNTGYSNPEYDAACRNALQSLPGEPGFVENHLRAQGIFADDLPVVPLHLRLKVGAARPDLCGYIIDSTQNSDLWNIEAFERKNGCP